MPTIIGPYSVAPDPANELLGRGKLFIDKWDTGGNRTGQQDFGNCSVYEVEDKVEVKEKYEQMDPEGSLYARAVTRQTVTLKITGDEITLDNIATALNGTIEQIAATGATITAETITPSGGAVLGLRLGQPQRQCTDGSQTGLDDVGVGDGLHGRPAQRPDLSTAYIPHDYRRFPADRGLRL
jgi:hypothetical protein